MSKSAFIGLVVASLGFVAVATSHGQPVEGDPDIAPRPRITRDDQLVASLIERGLTSQRAGEFRRAIDDLERSRKLRPDHPQATLALSWLLATCPDDAIRNGHAALQLAGDLCDPITCGTTESLTALAAAFAEIGEFDKAETLQERAVALSRFAPDFHRDSARRLKTIRERKPIREGRTPLVILERVPQKIPREVNLDEALAAPADVLGTSYLTTQTLLMNCPLAKAGATIHSLLDEQPLAITSVNVARVERLLKARKEVYAQAIRQRGHARLAPGYAARADGGCNDWEIGPLPTLVEQDGFEIFLSQGPLRHMGVVVESRVVFRHDSNTSIVITGTITDGAVVFTSPMRGGISGTADRRCVLTLTPSDVEGPTWAMAFAGRAMAHKSYGEYAAMFADLERALRLDQNADLKSLEAILLATCPDAKFRDGKKAVAAAELARKLAGDSMNERLATSLALAYAEAGDFGSAVEWQKKVIALVPEDEKPQQREHLRKFEAKQPVHEPSPF